MSAFAKNATNGNIVAMSYEILKSINNGWQRLTMRLSTIQLLSVHQYQKIMYQINHAMDRARALDILEKAFYNVPGITWMIRNKNKSKEHLRILLSVCLEEAILKKGAYLTSDKNGVIFLYNLRLHPMSIIILLKKLYLFIRIIGLSHGIRVLRSRRLINAMRPKCGWYGWFIATDRDARKWATALEIKNEVFRLSNNTNEPVFAETTLQRIANLYEKIGFKVYAKMKHPYEDMDIWFMRRDPGSTL